MTQLSPMTDLPGTTRPGGAAPRSRRAGLDVAGTAFLGHPVVLTVGGQDRLLARATAYLTRLTALWDVRVKGSDLHRLLVGPACVVDVSAETVLLARRALADDELRARLGLPTGGGGVVQARRNRVGLLPASAARAGQLLLACAVDLVAEQFRADGARRAVVRIGSTTRAFGGAVPAVRLELPGLARDVVLEDDALAVAVQPSHVHGGAVARDDAVAVAVHAPQAWQAQSLADAALLLPGSRAAAALARSARGGLVLHAGGGWTSTSGVREQP